MKQVAISASITFSVPVECCRELQAYYDREFERRETSRKQRNERRRLERCKKREEEM